MKKGKLFKEGKTWKIESAELKTSPIAVMGDFGLLDSMNGAEVEFDHTGGPVNLVLHAGKEYRKKAWVEPSNPARDQRGSYQQRDQRYDYRGSQQQKPKAFAPYNFVPLNDKVVPSNADKTNHSVYNGLSGTIELEVKALTPLFIKGNDYRFHELQGKPFIPGSSMRGMIRNLVSIVSYGRLHENEFEDRRLYKRSTIADDTKNNVVFAGFMTFQNGVYQIKKCRASQLANHPFKDTPYSYSFIDSECIFSTGAFGKRGSIVWKFNEPNGTSYKVEPHVIESYNSDDTRAEDAIDVLHSLKIGHISNSAKSEEAIKIPERGIPVFFRLHNDNIVYSFGHAKYHRIPYQNSIKDLIHQAPIDSVDIATSIFGDLNIASKVFFGDMMLEGNVNYALNEPKYLKILSSPKPTSFKNYLVQSETFNGVKKWSDPDANIRGFKHYWHRQTSSNPNHYQSWVESNEKTSSHIKEPINPLKEGSTFKGTVRFENLTPEELGALLFSLDLPNEHAHKLGMGKPLGLGSVRISINLTLIDRINRYQNVFDDKGEAWISGEETISNFDEYIDSFVKYIAEQTNQSAIIVDARSYRKEDSRMRDLFHMLKFTQNLDHKQWIERTRYQEIENKYGKNEFKECGVLPGPPEVVKRD